MFIARILVVPELVTIYREYLSRINLGSVVGELTQAILESHALFGRVPEGFLRNRFVGRDDINLFMQQASTVDVEPGIDFNRYWVGKYLVEAVKSAITPSSQSVNDIRQMAMIAESLDQIADGTDFNTVKVWDFVQASDERLNNTNLDRFVCKTGIPRLDDQMKMADCTVTIFVAPYKRYKSIVLTNVGAAALAQGLNVFHLHYEGKDSIWETRYDSCLTGIAKDRLYRGMTPAEVEKYRRVYQKIRERNTRIYFMKGAPHVTGIADVEEKLRTLKLEGIEFQVIIVDYLNLLKAFKGRKGRDNDDWLEQGDQAWDLVRLANKGYIVVSAAQTKTSGVERERIRSQDTGRSIVIQQAISNLVAIDQTVTEREQGIIRMSPLFFRDSELTTSSVTLEMSLWKMRISRDIDRLLDGAFSGSDGDGTFGSIP